MELVQQADFVVVELSLYTNTHPDDEEAIEQWREAIIEVANIRRKYEKRYGPISLLPVPSEEEIELGWRWSDPPWPWQR